MKTRLPTRGIHPEMSGPILRNYNVRNVEAAPTIPQSDSHKQSTVSLHSFQKQKESLSMYNRALLQQVQSLNNSLPLLKIDFEKVELELSDIRVSLKREVTKSPLKRDISPAQAPYQSRAAYMMTRGSSGSRQPDTQSTILDKIYHMERSMEKFKEDFLKRERAVMGLITSATEANLTAQKSVESFEEFGESRGARLENKESDEKHVLYSRIQELQRLNSELLGELRAANKKLINANVERIQESPFSSDPATGKAWGKAAGSAQRRGYSQPRDTDPDSEKHQLNARLIILNKELEKTNQIHEEKIIEVKTEYRKKLDVYLIKLANASSCVNKFLLSMQNLQMGVVKRDECNMERLRNEFETQKAQLIALAKDIKVFDEVAKRDTVRKINLAVTKEPKGMLIKRGRTSAEDTKRLEEDIIQLKREHEKTIIEKAQLENLVETLKKSSRQRPQSSQRSQEACKNNPDVTLKRRIVELEILLREKDSETQMLKRNSNTELRSRLMFIMNKYEKQVLTKLSKLDYKATVETESIERLHTLLMKTMKEKFNMQKINETYEERAEKIDELEKRMSMLKSSMKQEYEMMETENKHLKVKFAEMQGVAEETRKKLASQLLMKDMAIKKDKAKIEELSMYTKKGDKRIQELEAQSVKLKSDLSKRTSNVILLKSLRSCFSKMIDTNQKNMQVKLDELGKHIDLINNSLVERETVINEYGKLKPTKSFNIMDLKENALMQIDQLIKANQGKLLDRVVQGKRKLASAESTLNKTKAVLKQMLDRSQSIEAENAVLKKQLLKEKEKMESLVISLNEAEFNTKETLVNISEQITRKQEKLNNIKKCISALKAQYTSRFARNKTELRDMEMNANSKDKVIQELNQRLLLQENQLKELELNNEKELFCLKEKNDMLVNELSNKSEQQAAEAKLKEIMNELEERRKQVNEMNEASQSKNNELIEKMQEKDNFLNSMQIDYENKILEKDDLIQQLKGTIEEDSMTKELYNKLKENTKSLQMINDKLVEELGLKKIEIEKSQKVIEDLTKENISIKKEKEELKLNYEKELEKNVQEKDKHIAELNTKLLTLEDDIQKTNEAIKQNNAEIIHLNEDLKISEDLIKEKNRTLKELQSAKTEELNMLSEELSIAKEDVQRMKEAIETATTANESLKSKLQETENAIEIKNGLIEELKASKGNEFNELLAKLEEAENTVKNRDKEIEEINANTEERVNEITQKLIESERSIEEKSSIMDVMKEAHEGEISKLDEKLSVTENKLKEIESMKATAEEETNKRLLDMQTSLKDKEKIIEDYKITNATTESEFVEVVSKLKEELAEKEQIIENLNNNNKENQSALESTIKDKDNEIEAIKTECEKKINENLAEAETKLKEKDSIMNTTQASLEGKIKELANNLKLAEDTILDKDRAIEEATMASEAKVNELVNKAAESEATLKENERILTQIKAEHETDVKNLSELNKLLQEQASNAGIAKVAHEQDINELNKKVEDANNIIKERDGEIVDLKENCKKLNQRINEVTKIMEGSETENGRELKEVYKQLNEKKEMIEELNVKLNNLNKASSEEMQEKDKIIKDLKESFTAYEKEMEDKENKANTKLQQYTEEAKEKDIEIEDLNKAIDDLKQSNEMQIIEERNEYEAKLEKFSTEIMAIKSKQQEEDEIKKNMQLDNEKQANELAMKEEIIKELSKSSEELQRKLDEFAESSNSAKDQSHQRIIELEQQLDEIRTANKGLEGLIAEREIEIKEIENNIANSKETLNESIANLQVQYDELKEENQKLVNESNINKTTIEVLNEEIKNVNTDMKDMKDIITIKFNEMSGHIFGSLTEFERKTSVLYASIDKLMQKHYSSLKTNKELKVSLQATKKQHEELLLINKQLEDSIAKIEETNLSSNKGIAAYGLQAKELVSTVNEKFKSIAESAFKKFMEEIEGKLERIDTLQKQISQLRNSTSKLIEETLAKSHLDSEKNNLISEKNGIIQDLTESLNAKNNIIQELNSLILENDNTAKTFNENISAKEKEIEELNKVIQSKDDTINKLNNLVKEKATVIDTKEKDIVDINMDKEKLLEAKDKIIKEKEEYIVELSTDIGLQLKNSQMKATELDEENEKLHNEITQLKNRNDILLASKEELKTSVNRLIEELGKDAETRNNTVIDAIENINKRIISFYELLSELKQCWKNHAKTVDSDEKQELVNKDEQLLNALEKIDELKGQLILSKEANIEMVEQYNKQSNNALKTAFTYIHKSLIEGVEELLKQVRDKQCERIENYETIISELKDKIENLQIIQQSNENKYSSLLDEKESLIETQREELAQQDEKLKQNLIEFDKLTEDHKVTFTIHEKEKQQLEDTINELQQKMGDLETSQASNKDAKEMQEANAKLTKQIEESDTAMNGLMEKMMSVQMENAELKQQVEEGKDTIERMAKENPKSSSQKNSADQMAIINSLQTELTIQVKKMNVLQKQSKKLADDREHVKKLLIEFNVVVDAFPQIYMDKIDSLQERLIEATRLISSLQLPATFSNKSQTLIHCQKSIHELEGKIAYLRKYISMRQIPDIVLEKIQRLCDLRGLNTTQLHDRNKLLEEEKSNLLRLYDGTKMANSDLKLQQEKMKRELSEMMKANSELTEKMIVQSETGSLYNAENRSLGPASNPGTCPPPVTHLEDASNAQLLEHIKVLVTQCVELIPLK